MKCLFCYKSLKEGEIDYHKACARKIFESTTVPVLPYTRANIKELAREIVTASTTVTGVQAKLSLDISRGHAGEPQRFTIVGLWGRFILKPQTDRFAHLPENEDLTMHMAEAAGIKTVPHSLIRFVDGELCYLTRRVDRTKKGAKIAMEDMCQLSERLTEDKYKGSYDADMHLKNFSLFRPAFDYMMTPAYDLLSTALAMPEDDEELALTLNGKKKRIKREDFEIAMRDSGLEEKAISNLFLRFSKAIPKWHELITESFLPLNLQKAYHDKIDKMVRKISEL